MRTLKPQEMGIVAGGSTPSLVCSVSGDASHSEQICQTSSGLTVITTKDTIDVGGSVGITGKFKELLGIQGEAHWRETTTQRTVCTPDGNCKDSPPTTTREKIGDASDGSDFESFAGGGDYGGGGDGGGCVQIASRLPCGTLAGDILVGSEMQLSDQVSLKAGVGVVSYSKRKKAPGYRLTTVSGVSLVCSNTAPIPTTDGIVLAPNVLGKSVAVRRDEGGESQSAWEVVTSVDAVGEIEVQHITVGDKCFWAGEKPNVYILHHNMKNADYSYGAEDITNNASWDDWA